MKKTNKSNNICIWIIAVIAFVLWMYFFYILVFEGPQIPW